MIGLIILLVVGPQDIPKIMYQAGRFFRRMHYMKFALSQQFDDFMEKAEQQAATQKEAQDNAAIAQENVTQTNEGAKAAKDEAVTVTAMAEEELSMDESNPYFVKAEDEEELDSDDVALVVPATSRKQGNKDEGKA